MTFLSRIWPKKWVATAIVVATILYLTLVPKPLPDDISLEIPGLDKVVHAIMFGGLAFVASLDLARRSKTFCPLSKMSLIAVASAATLFGGVVEFLQQSMQLGRGGDIIDFAADCIGAFVAVMIAKRILNRAPMSS